MGERIVVTGRIGSSPRKRGSLSGQTCPDFVSVQGDMIGVIGETLGTEPSPDLAHLVVPADLVYDALADILRLSHPETPQYPTVLAV